MQLQTLNPGKSRTIDAPVRSVEVHSGTIVVTPPDYAGMPSVAVGPEDGTYAANNTASLNIHSATGARFSVTLADEPVPPAPKTKKKAAK
jgi:hypothetical protein